MVCLTGQVPTHLIGNDAFQEADTTGITRPATKHNYLVKDIDNLASVMRGVLRRRPRTPGAGGGRPAEGYFDGRRSLRATARDRPSQLSPAGQRKPDAIEEAVDLIAAGKQQMPHGGGELVDAGPQASDLFRQFVKETGCPCTLTLMGLGAYPSPTRSFWACSACTAPMRPIWPCMAVT